MTIQNGRYIPQTEQEILDAMLSAAEESFDRELGENEEATIIDFAEPFAGYFAEQQEVLRDVLDAAQIDHADGQALDYLGSLIGVPRRDERAAETRLQFRSDSPVTRDYTIPSGTEAYTDNSDPIRFETDESSILQYIDGFESGNLDDYGGDTASFNVQTATVDTGSYALEATASGEIGNPSIDIQRGARFHYAQQLASGAVAGFIFGASDLQNYYDVTLDQTNGTISIGRTESGTRTELNSGSATLSAGEWHDVQVDWGNTGTFTVTVEDSTGTQVGDVTAQEPSVTFPSGGIGFRSTTTNSAYFDEATTSRVSVPATATTESADTNVGPNTLVILGTSVNGVDSVTNPNAATGGRDKELDADYRERAKDELSQGTSATLPAVINAIDQMPQTRTVTVIDNDSDSTDAAGRPPHSFEPLVDVDTDFYEDVAETIVDVKAVGDASVGGYAGTKVTRTVELPNEQTKDVSFSIPTAVQIYADVDLQKRSDEYPGDDRVASSIVQYIGGVLTSGDNTDGEIGVGDDVIYNQVLEAIMDINGVYDVTNLEIGTSSSPTGTSNIAIADSENATADATDSSLSITSSNV
jgi:uncharacterized phage protein gp47/JayE